jgi:hypothetical protein
MVAASILTQSMASRAMASTTIVKCLGRMEYTSMSGAGLVKSMAWATPSDRELDRVHVVAERVVQRPGAVEHLRLDRRTQVALGFEVAAAARVVADGEDELLAHADAAHVVLEVDELLDGHHQGAGLVVGPDELPEVVHPGDVLPPAPVRRLEDGGEAHVAGDALPVERVLEVPEAALGVDGGMYDFDGRSTVRGTFTPMRPASEYPKNLSSALHQNGSLTT